MAATIKDGRVIIDRAESLTGWSSPVAGQTLVQYGVGQADTTPLATEGDLHIAQVVSTDEVDIVHTFTADDYSDKLIYVWVLANGIMDTKAGTKGGGAAGGIGIILGDATPDRVVYHIAGSDVAAFRHNTSRVGAQCLVLDTSNLSALTGTAISGTAGNLDTSNMTEIGAYYSTLNKSVGNAENCFTDIIRVGNAGLTITAGSTGAPATFQDITDEDADSSAFKKYGICRELGAGLYGLQGPLTFGATGAGFTYFRDDSVTVTFEDRSLANDKYFLKVEGNTTDDTTFHIGEKVGTQGGSAGGIFIAPTGTGAKFDASNPNLQYCLLYGSTFNGYVGPTGASIVLSTDATNSPNHEVFGCSFGACGMIDPGLVNFKNNDILASVDSIALTLPTSTTNLSDLSFTSSGTGHAILIENTGTYSFTNFNYTGYAATDGSTGNEVVFNDSGGAVTINVSGGDSPTVRNGSGATTDVINTVDIDYHVEDADGTAVEKAQVYIQKQTPTEQFSGAGNNAGDGDLVVSATIDSDIPQTGWVIVSDISETATLPYRYVSHDGANTFTFATTVTGNATSTGSSTQLIDTGAFAGTTVQEGDTIRNIDDTSWAVVDEIISDDEIRTSALRGGTDDTWESGDQWSIHDLATTLVNGVDQVDVPLVNRQTNASGDITTKSYNYGTPLPVTIRVRKNEGTPKYIPFRTSATIEGDFSGTAVLTEDTVAQ